ncbi:MAG: O-antigen ligase family protein [Magnetococcales bacterium]|nr:O-antigen ligase family protein [Magnetococcales bacterium]
MNDSLKYKVLRVFLLVSTVFLFITMNMEHIGLRSNPSAKVMLMAALLAIAAIPVLLDYLQYPVMSRTAWLLLLAFVPLMAAYVPTLLTAGDKMVIIQRIAQLMLLAIWAIGVMRMARSNLLVLFLQWFFILLVFSNFAAWLAQGARMPMLGLFGKKNMLPYIMVPSIYFLLLPTTGVSLKITRITRLACWSALFMTFITAMLASARVAALCYIFTIMAYMAWPIISKTALRYKATMMTMFFGALFIIVIIASLMALQNFSLIDDLTTQVTGRNIHSGRETIWPLLLLAISQKPLFGWGADVRPGTFFVGSGHDLSQDYSAHNLFLQVGLDAGLFGVLGLLFLIWRIWVLYMPWRHMFRVRLAAILLLANVLQQSFGVSMTQSNMYMAIIIWSVIGFALGEVERLNKSTQKHRFLGLGRGIRPEQNPHQPNNTTTNQPEQN